MMVKKQSWIVFSLAVTLILVLVALNVAAADTNARPENVLFYDSAEEGTLDSSKDPTIMEKRFVDINFDLLDEAEIGDRVIFNMFADAVFTGVIESIEAVHSGDYGLVGYDGDDWDVPVVAADGTPIGGEYGDVHGIIEAPDGSVWVIADGDLYHLYDEQWRQFTWPDNWIGTMAVGPDGTVWVGSDEALGRFYPSSGEWETFTPEDGLIHPDVEAIHVTPDGVVWIGTEGGGSRYVPGE